ncbi:Sm-like ribonucleo protein [Yamadazyma tenuis ATCC 10573]|uniref:Small nuclear ribonucleoprotein Sm D2 n=1 Tax=Candida tenuis (strain ATCC 10573 / BCRC 21748 / CBS 615 / JCM 9827 / NBRC 10315 / NRRL Y-1498 / VKM Y-70) TaxID=590646 RepID=G3B2A6_CANTC|nr:Sm-like ribonucleoprotein [Yamadazyma tenuis ATCC 10573]EGV64630.1 Sm-like ribonucleo protein [Yamadazyma tenuis ATCC 10573]
MAYVTKPKFLSGDDKHSRIKHTNKTFSDLVGVPKSDLNQQELERLEEFEFNHGPMSLLKEAVANNTPVVISCRNNHKLVAKVKAFDRHCNLILENVKELWTEPVKNNKGKVIKVNQKERFVSKLFLRGDSVIVVVKA